KDTADPITTISLDEDLISLVIGTSQTLTATTDASVDASDIDWYSDNSEIATVVGGKVSAVGAGRTVVSAKIGNSTAFCDVIVTEEIVPVTGVILNKDQLELKIGD